MGAMTILGNVGSLLAASLLLGDTASMPSAGASGAVTFYLVATIATILGVFVTVTGVPDTTPPRGGERDERVGRGSISSATSRRSKRRAASSRRPQRSRSSRSSVPLRDASWPLERRERSAGRSRAACRWRHRGARGVRGERGGRLSHRLHARSLRAAHRCGIRAQDRRDDARTTRGNVRQRS